MDGVAANDAKAVFTLSHLYAVHVWQCKQRFRNRGASRTW